jgi:hypothetical protein
VKILCASKISPNCIGGFDIPAYDESQEPYICDECDSYINSVLAKKEIKNEFRADKTGN